MIFKFTSKQCGAFYSPREIFMNIILLSFIFIHINFVYVYKYTLHL